MKRIALASTAIALLAGWLLLRHATLTQGAALPDAGKRAVPVQLATVERREVAESAPAIGTVQAYNSVLVRPRVDGQLERVEFREGQEVGAGDVLARIDPRPFEAALRGARAQKDRDAAQLANVERDLARYAEIAPRGTVPAQTLDAARAQRDQLEAAVRVDQAAIDRAELELGYTTIRAPLAGRVGARLVDAGNLVRAADPTGLVLITQVHPIAVSFTLPQDRLPALRAAQRLGAVPVQAAARDAATPLASGVVSLIDNQIDAATGTIRVKAVFDNAGDVLWPGQFVTLDVRLDTRRDALTIPATAVQIGAEGAHVFVIGDGEVAELRPVEFRRAGGDLAVVTAGLVAGERVVTEGHFKLAAGARVRDVGRPQPN